MLYELNSRSKFKA